MEKMRLYLLHRRADCLCLEVVRDIPAVLQGGRLLDSQIQRADRTE